MSGNAAVAREKSTLRSSLLTTCASPKRLSHGVRRSPSLRPNIRKRSKKFSIIVNVQGDEPLVDPPLIDRLVETLQTNRDVGIATAAHPFSDARDALSPHQVKVVIDRAGNALYFSRAPIPASRNAGGSRSLFLRHQGIYGFRRATLLQFVQWKPTPLERCESLEQLRALENGVTVHVLVTKHGSPGVDTPADAQAVAASLRGYNLQRPGR